MADDPKPENAAAEAAGNAAAAVVEHTEHVEAQAASAIDAAQAEANAAREESKRIAAAALDTALGHEIKSTREGFDTWRTEHENRINPQLAEIPELKKQVTDLQAGVALLVGALKPASQSASIPPKSEGPPAETIPAKNPDENAGVPPVEKPPAPTSRKRHLL